MSMSNPNDPNQTVSAVADQKAMAGVDKYLANAGQVSLQGKSYTPAAIKAVLQSEIDTNKAVDLARASVKQQVADARPVRASARSMRSALRKYLLSAYGASAVQVLEDFGFKLPKPTGPQTAEARAEAQKKAKATRKAKKDALAKVAATLEAQTVPVSTTPQK
jgi:hypothetical protein